MSDNPKNPIDLPFPITKDTDAEALENIYLKTVESEALDKENLKGKKQDRKERKVYANLTFSLITMWLTFILIIFVAIGKRLLVYSDTVIVTLLSTTTINVIGLFLIVARYLFPPKV